MALYHTTGAFYQLFKGENMSSIIINSVVYSDVPEIDVPKQGGGTAKFYDTSAADAASGDILTTKTAYGASGSISGSMANNGSTGGSISTKAGTITIPAGYTSGGTVKIADAEQAKIIAANIKSGVTILGQAGSLSLPTISQDSGTKILSIS